jgi:glycosyltransferase involved in cell wall biosynthesis
MIRVGMDISQIAHTGGVGVYSQNLAQKLSKLKDLEMIYFYSSLRRPEKSGLKNVKKFKLPPTFFEMLFNRWRNVPIEKFIGSIDIFHSSDWIQPPTKAKKVTTYHDLIPILHPEWSVPKIVDVHKRRLKIVENEVDMVIAVSNATKKDLLKVSTVPEEKIIVIYEAVDEEFKKLPAEEVEEFRARYKLPEKFVLAIGGVGEIRNLKRVKQASKKYNLIITRETMPEIPYKEFPLLYNAASILLYPSFYGGFGLPILEAMACGVPVITSSISSFPEVGGNAAEYINPESVVDIENRLREIWNSEDKREKMIQKGFEQAKKFSWEKCAKETSDVYRKLVEK